MKIAVIGCGVGGQAAALFLSRQGHEVEIFERFPEAKPVGAGLLLQPPGQAALVELGLFRNLAPKGARRAHVAYYQLGSRALTPFFQSHSRILGGLRDAFMRPFCRLPLTGDVMVATLSGVRCLPFGT